MIHARLGHLDLHSGVQNTLPEPADFFVGRLERDTINRLDCPAGVRKVRYLEIHGDFSAGLDVELVA